MVKTLMRVLIVFIFLAVFPAIAQIEYTTGFVKGRITFYSQSSSVACDIPMSEWPQYTTALSEKHFQNGFACGTTAIIKNGAKQIQVMVVDLCPVKGNEQWCSGDLPHFDLGNSTAFSQLENPSVGVKEVQIEFVPTPVGDTPVKLRNKDGINAYWYAVQVLNHRYPIAKLEIQDPKSGSWITGQKKTNMWNYWVFSFTGNGLTTPFQIRITDQYGQVIEETGNSVQEKYMWTGTHQFPVYGGSNALLPFPESDGHYGSAVNPAPFISHGRLFCGASLPVEIAIIDCTGRTIAAMTIASGASRIQPPVLRRGVYYVRVVNKQKSSLLRWVCLGNH
jgi:expansin (peptidoglycan-binding protein)